MSKNRDKEILIRMNKQAIASSENETLLSSLTAAGVRLDASCGGRGICGKCRIKILQGQVADAAGNPAQPQPGGYYLACQTYPQADLVLEPVVQAGISKKGEVAASLLPGMALSPLVRKTVITPRYPTLDNPLSLQKMIVQETGAVLGLELGALKDLARYAPGKAGKLTLIQGFKQIIALEPGEPRKILFGAAFDIGSTTVAAMLVNLENGELVAAAADTNPQVSFGADVISRIKAARNQENFAKLTGNIRMCLNSLINQLCAAAHISKDNIYAATIVGNSTMAHLLLGISPESLVSSPYVTVFNEVASFPPVVIGLDINSAGRITMLPNIASFVGADTVAAALAVDQDLRDEMILLIDLGTNGEMVLGNKNRLVVCSTAAGPAFEGAQLSSGMRASDGAIDEVRIGRDVYLTTINQARPKGICGSGAIKAIAELKKAGLITESGRFISDKQMADFPAPLQNRIKTKDGRKEFVLVSAADSETGQDISITQADIREIQLVKSSIRTGAGILMERLGVMPEDVDHLYIAGAFGNYIDLDSALTIGLVPSIDRHKIQAVGNAAGTGAIKALLSEEVLARSFQMAKQAEFIELANHPNFQNQFFSNLSFPEVVDENKQ